MRDSWTTDRLSRRDWWIGIGLLVAAIGAHALFPRYEWRDYHGMPIIRVDRWRGVSQVGQFQHGVWVARGELVPEGVAPPAVNTPSATPPPVDLDDLAKKYGGVPAPKP